MKGPRLVHLVRHGQTDWNVDGRLQGHAGIPLNERGRCEAWAAARRFNHEDMSRVYTSDLARALETARIIANGVPVVLEPRLREINTGIWTGLQKTKVEAEDSLAWREWREGSRGVIGGESYVDLQARAVAALKEILSRETGGNVLVVTHRGVIRVLIAYFTHQSISSVYEPQTGSTATLQVNDGEIRVLTGSPPLETRGRRLGSGSV